MSARPIHDQNDFLVGVSSGQLVEIETHDFGVDPRQERGKRFAAVGGNAGVKIEVAISGFDQCPRSDTVTCPAAAESRFQTEASFIKEEEPSLGLRQPGSDQFSRFF